jgi:hypothetical protein
MNWLKKGPELKLSELKVPDFLYDLFYDLKERHLLPLVALLIVAIIGAPIYFKSSTKSDPEPATTAGTTATASSVAGGGETLVVAHSTPGLRSYKLRLKKYRELDPFEKRGEEEASAATESSGEEAATVAPAEATVVGEETGGLSEAPAVESAPYSPEAYESGAPESGPADHQAGKAETRYATDVIDVRIVTVAPHPTEEKRAKGAEPKAEVRRNLPELSMLPDRQTPAATYIGLSNDGKKALFVVSSDVISLFGEGKCVIGSQTCQMLALEPGLPETFVYGPQERTFRIELLKIDTTYSAKPRRATLGATKGKGQSQGGEAGGAGTEAAAPTGSEPAERG